MKTRPVILTIVLTLFSLSLWGQNMSQVDSVRLFATWKKTADYLRTKDTVLLRTLCLDSIYCTLCGFRNDTIVETDKPLSIFFKDGLDHINANKKLWKIIDSETPDLMVSGYIDKIGNKDRVYGIAYLLWKPNELGKKHEGVQVVFDYVLRNNEFKLSSISTVP